jgi:general secretion pathway protein A
MMQRLERTVLVAYIFNPRLTVPEFYQHVTTLLDVQQWETKSELLIALGRTLESRHARGLRTVLIIDEAQGLTPHVLEEIRLLSNFESDSAKQLQIVLTGQPELRAVLNNPDLRQLKQRIALRCEIKPLPNVEETGHYIFARLLVAGAERTDIFSPGAIDFIFRCSEGIPRNINNLCDNALLTGYGAGAPVIGRSIIEEVAETFDMLPSADRGRQMGEEREAPARIFTAAGRAELWATGGAAGSTAAAANVPITDRQAEKSAGTSATHNAPHNTPAVVAAEKPASAERKDELTTPSAEEVGAAFRRSGLLRNM